MWVANIHTPKQNNRQNYSFAISIFTFNKISVPNNNLLQNDTFGRLSRWLPQPKHFSGYEILTSLSPIYRTNIYNGGSALQNTTYLITASSVWTPRLFVNTTSGQNTCCVFDSCWKMWIATGRPLLTLFVRIIWSILLCYFDWLRDITWGRELRPQLHQKGVAL